MGVDSGAIVYQLQGDYSASLLRHLQNAHKKRKHLKTKASFFTKPLTHRIKRLIAFLNPN